MLIPNPFGPPTPSDVDALLGHPEPPNRPTSIAAVTTDQLRSALAAALDRLSAAPPVPPSAEEVAAITVGLDAHSGARSPIQNLERGVAFATAIPAKMFEALAATIDPISLQFGLPHTHSHPPAMPSPLPSLGVMALGGSQSVLIDGAPAARAGDLGFAASCGCFSPVFQVVAGSSKVFYGQHRAARSFDLTTFCKPVKPLLSHDGIPRLDSVLNIAVAVAKSRVSRQRASATAEAADVERDASVAASLAAESEGHALAARIHANHALMSAAAQAMQMTVGLDPAAPPVPAVAGALATIRSSVLVGGFQLPRTLNFLVGLKKQLAPLERFDPYLRLGAMVLRGAPPGRVLDEIPPELRFVTGHPVDVITGSLVFTACDVDLPGALPLRFARSYSSTWSTRTSPLGRGWSHSLDEAVWLEPRHLVYRAEDGRELELPRDVDEIYVPRHRLTVRRRGADCWQIEDAHGVRRDFAPISGDPHPGVARLVMRRDRLGHALRCRHDERARLVAAQADGGRELHLHYTDDHITRIDLADPDGDGLLAHVRFVYDGDLLTEIHDALGQVTRYRHDSARICEEILPGGLRFHFAYESDASDAACVRTRGDGGVLDHRLIYDRPRRTTVVINACNETTIYRADPRGLVTEICDPHGATTRLAYDEHLRLTATTDALGHTTRRLYDERGNCTRIEHPDGGVTSTRYHETLDLPVSHTDAAGGESRWSYDAQGRVTRHTDPLGRCTVHHHDLSPGTGRSETVVHPDGRSEQRTHDAAGRLAHVRRSDGASISHLHDRRGRLRRSTDERGRVEAREYDLLGRLTRHALPSGEVLLYTHDARGRVLRACAASSDLRCSHTGLGWLVSCGEASAAPFTIERDLEGRVSRVAGPTGTLLRVERDAAGRVRGTVDALGVERRLTRDLLGRVVAVRRPGGKHTRFIRDPLGRITHVEHDDGVHDEFTYRPDGALLTAIRRHSDGLVTTVRRELDAAGRITREHQDERAVALEYDITDRLTRLRSSLGADLRFVHDDRGLARVELPRDPWALGFERDRDGREQARHLPGEVLAWWHHDRRGRPTEHGLVASRPPQIFRHRRYTWTDRLERIDESARRRAPAISPTPTVIHTRDDAEGRRVAADLSDGTSWRYGWTGAGELREAAAGALAVTYRHDALGRRICRTRDGLATRWLWHGDVPLHTWSHARDVITWVFAPGTFTPLARLAADARHALVTDHLGTPLAALDERGQLDWSAEFDAQHQPRPTRGAPTLCPFRFSGQTADPDTGLAHNRFREYDPATRRFLSPDPLGLLGGLDPHAHVADPRVTTDVLGLTSDRPDPAHARIAAELAHDFPLHDLPPAIRHALTGSFAATDHAHAALAALQSPFRGPCE